MSAIRNIEFALRQLIVFSAIALSGQVSAVAQNQTGSQVSATGVAAAVATPPSQKSFAFPVRRQEAVRIATSDFSNEMVPQRKALAGQFVRWYSTLGLGRHGPAVAFELLLIACFVALRIHAKREDRAATKTSTHALDANKASSE
jgi:hypothetical protein